MELRQWKRREMRTPGKQSGSGSLPGQLTASAVLLAKARSDRADFIRGLCGHSDHIQRVAAGTGSLRVVPGLWDPPTTIMAIWLSKN